MAKNAKQEVVPSIAAAKWLIENTVLTFDQIAAFCNLYVEQVNSIADDILGKNVIPYDLVKHMLLTKDEIKRCEKNQKASLQFCFTDISGVSRKATKVKKYTPMLQRKNRPEAILFLTSKTKLSDAQIRKLLNTTKDMIQRIRNRDYKDFDNLVAKDPVTLGFCSQRDLDAEIAKVAANSSESE